MPKKSVNLFHMDSQTSVIAPHIADNPLERPSAIPRRMFLPRLSQSVSVTASHIAEIILGTALKS